LIFLAADILFSSGKAALSEGFQGALSEAAEVLASIEGRSYQVEGHTDDVPISTAQYPSNWDLAAARAIGVVRSLIEAGLPPQRVSAASFSDNKPAAPNDTDENRARNRRIEIVIVPALSELPGFEELNQLSSGSG